MPYSLTCFLILMSSFSHTDSEMLSAISFSGKHKLKLKQHTLIQNTENLCPKQSCQQKSAVLYLHNNAENFSKLSDKHKNKMRMILILSLWGLENIGCISSTDAIFLHYLDHTIYADISKTPQFPKLKEFRVCKINILATSHSPHIYNPFFSILVPIQTTCIKFFSLICLHFLHLYANLILVISFPR